MFSFDEFLFVVIVYSFPLILAGFLIGCTAWLIISRINKKRFADKEYEYKKRQRKIMIIIVAILLMMYIAVTIFLSMQFHEAIAHM